MKYKNTTICCIFDNDRVLMIKKLTAMRNFSDAIDGHGKDRFNFPGGKCEVDESFINCAIRESIDETGIEPIDPQFIGQLQFVWPDMVLINQVFRADKFTGVLKKMSAESENMWVPVTEIPFDNMWPSDKIWVPEVIARKPFHFKVSGANDNPICERLPLDWNIKCGTRGR